MRGSDRYPWIVACDGSNPDYPFGFACTRCGTKEPIQSGIPIDAWAAWAKSFQARHKLCVEEEAMNRKEPDAYESARASEKLTLQQAARYAQEQFAALERQRAEAAERDARETECPGCAEKDKRITELEADLAVLEGTDPTCAITSTEARIAATYHAELRACEERAKTAERERDAAFHCMSHTEPGLCEGCPAEHDEKLCSRVPPVERR